VRALLIVLDSVGIGGAPDAAAYGDEGADTLGHILEQTPGLQLPALESCGLGELVGAYRSHRTYETYRASYGRMRERSAGKDTTTGHWELAGAVLAEPFAVFDRFPAELVHAIEREAGVEFIGNYARSGTHDSGGAGRRAPPHSEANSLHICRFRAADRRARAGDPDRPAISYLRSRSPPR
jgi:phosphopentomutase